MSLNLSSLISGMHDDEETFNIAHVDLSREDNIPTNNAVKENNATNSQVGSTDGTNKSGDFDPNVMFDIGIRNVEGNPFSQEELSSLAEELDERANPNNAQTLNIEEFDESSETPSFETNMNEPSTIVVSSDDNKDFELVGTSLTESDITIGDDDLGGITLGGDDSSEDMFSIISSQAEEVNAEQYAEKFNPNAVITSQTSEDEEVSITIEEDNSSIELVDDSWQGAPVEEASDEIQVLDHTIEEQKEFDYISQIDKVHGTENKPPTQEQYYNTPPADYHPEQIYTNTQGDAPVPKQDYTVKNDGDVFPLYETPLGDKVRVSTTSSKAVAFETTNPHILDFDSLVVGQDAIGEVFVKDVNVIPYGTNGQTRVVWKVETKNKVEHEFAQFNLSDTIKKSELEPFINHTVSLTGKVGTRNSNKNLVVTLMELARYTTPLDFGVGTADTQDTEMEMYKDWYRTLTATIRTPWMRELIKTCLESNGNLGRMLKESAGSKVHDSAEGGLFKHTMKVTMNSYLVARNYPQVNQDVVIVSALLHDIGKIYEMDKGKYTQIGELTGHIVLGQTIVSNAIQSLKSNGVEVNENERANIIHCILAHHGNLEWGSPVKPKTPEAMLLHLVDMIDARLTHMDEVLSGKDKAYSKTFGTSVFNLN